MENFLCSRKGGRIRRILAYALAIVMVLTSVGTDQWIGTVQAAVNTTTLYLKDDTPEHWIGNDNAVIELVDNTTGHDHYTMTRVDYNMWSCRVPATTYNVTFNRLNPSDQSQWNSWSAGGRDGHSTYHALGHEYGYWDGTAVTEEGFHEGDVIYLDFYEFQDWKQYTPAYFVNLTDASKQENGGNDIVVAQADSSKYAPVQLSNEVEDDVFSYTVTAAEEGATHLRFWRGNSGTLWNCSVVLSYTDYKAGNNCVKIEGWNDNGYVCPYVPRRHITQIDSIEMLATGSLKVNRKVTLDLAVTGETELLNTADTTITIEKALSDGSTVDVGQSVAYDTAASQWNHRELLFKEAGTYKITGAATDGTDMFCADTTIHIVGDAAPAADFVFDDDPSDGNSRIYWRDEDGKAAVGITDASASEAGDTITERTYKLYHDADNNGQFTENEIIDTISGNETHVDYELSTVGRYKVCLAVREHFENTIEALLDEGAYLTGDTADQADTEITFEIVNQAPSSSLAVSLSRLSDIIFTVGSVDDATLSKYMELGNTVQEYMEDRGIEAKVSTVSASAITAKDTFAWKDYGHDGHIVFNENDIVMKGYPDRAKKDFLYIEDNDNNRKEFEFDLQRDRTDWHSMEGGGFLFNTKVSDDENTIQGYCILVTAQGLSLIQINRVKLDSFRNGSYNLVQNAGMLLQTFSIQNVYDNHHIKIQVDRNAITVYDGETLVIDNYVLPDDGVDAYGYGPITSHRSHGCSQRSYFTFQNIVMRTVVGESLSDIVNNHEWTPGTNHYVINLSTMSVPELSGTARMSEVAAALIQNDAVFYGIGNETTVNQYNSLVNAIEGRGSSFLLTGASGEAETVTISQAMQDIMKAIASDVNSKDYSIGYTIATDEKVEYTGTYFDADDDQEGNEEWVYVYDKSVFGEEDGTETITQDEPITMFDDAGAYEIRLRVSDDPTEGNEALSPYIQWSDTDEYQKLILSQHRPVAKVGVSVMQSQTDSSKCMVNVTYEAADADHSSDSRLGIRDEKFYYKSIENAQWTEGRFPAEVPMGGIYLVKYVVTDIEGTVSRPAVAAVNTNVAREYTEPEDTTSPVCLLNVSADTVETGDSLYIEASATDDYGITEFHLTVNGEELSDAYGRFPYIPQEGGSLEITVTATDIGGNAGTATRTVSVVDNRDTTPPTITILSPQSGTITGSVNLIGTITDNRGITSYTVTRNKVEAEASEEEKASVIAEGTSAVENDRIAVLETDGLETGMYKIEIAAVDKAGNRNIYTMFLTVEEPAPADRIPPQASIDEIALSQGDQEILITGSVSDETELDRYELKMYRNGHEEDAAVIATGTTEVENDVIGTVLTEDMGDGEYTLLLTAWDTAGNRCVAGSGFTYEEGTESTVRQETDTVSPVVLTELKAEITEDGLRLKLTGTIADENLKSYTVQTGKADETNQMKNPVSIAVGTESVVDAGIADYTYENYETGDYIIEIRAEDQTGNLRTVVYRVTITSQGTLLEGYEGEKTGEGEDEAASLKLALSRNTADVGDQVQAYVTYPESATEVKLTAGGKETALHGRTADITADQVGELEVVLSARIGGEEQKVSATVWFRDGADKTCPAAAIQTPEADSSIKTKTDITGSVSDEQGLAYYILEYRMEGAENYTELSRGTEEVEAGVLGTLDASLLENGRYVLRLTAVDNGGNRTRVERGIYVEGGLKVGNLSIGFTDISSNVSGVPLTVVRYYDSRNKQSGDFGTGWRLGMEGMHLTESSDITEGYTVVQKGSLFSTSYQVTQTACHDVTVMYGDGTSDRFQLKVSPERRALLPIYEVQVEFACVTNQKVKLALNGDNTAMLTGGSLLFEASELSDSRSYVLTREDGTKLYLDQTHGLMKLEDTSGNTVKLTKNGFKHSDGKGIAFTRDAKGRIIKAEEKGDTAIRTITYSYDSRDDLVAVTDEAGRTVCFTYDDSHNLVSITDPSGIAVSRNEYDEDGRLTASIDADGNRTEYTHDVEGRTETVKDRRGNIAVYTYDDNGNVLQKVDAFGNRTTNTYDTYNNLLSTTDANGHTTNYAYDSSGNVTEVTAPDGTKVESAYTQDNYVTGIRMMNQTVMAMEYDSRGRLSSVEDANGNVTEYSYTAKGKLTGLTDAIGEYQKVTYDADGNVAATTNGAGESASYTYDEKGQCTSITVSRVENGETLTFTSHYTYNAAGDIIQSVDNAGNVTAYEYDADGRRTAAVDAESRRTAYAYDDMGNLVKTTYPDGTFETFTYDAGGNNITATGRSGLTVTMKYDKLDRMTEKAYADGTKETYVYDKVGNVTKRTSTSGAETTYTYDSRNRNTAITDAFGNTTAFTYDASARMTARTDAQGNTTSYQYDGNGNLTKTTYADGNSVTSEYDARNRVTSQKDQNGNETRYEYDGADRLTKVTDAYGNSFSYGYDGGGNLTTVTDAEGHVTHYTYDEVGRIKTVQNALGKSMEYTYDGTGNITRYQDYAGNVTTYVYDSMERVTEKTAGTEKTTYTYNEKGLLTKVTDAAGSITCTYDQYDRLASRTDTRGVTLTYTYDDAGRLKTFHNGSGTTTYGYDLLDRVTKVIDHNGKATVYEYDSLGNRSAVRYPNGNVMTYTYDACQRLKEECVVNGSGVQLAKYTYGIGKAGERTSVTEINSLVETDITYQYDKLNRLVKETIERNGNKLTNEYAYDKVSNRVSKKTSVSGDLSVLADTSLDDVEVTEGTTTYTYNAGGQLVTETSPAGSVIYTYDDNGNLVSQTGDKTVTYSYDKENHLLRATIQKGGSVTVESYTYDYAGNRTSKTVNETDTIYYVTDVSGDLPQVVAETDEAGNNTTFYTRGEDLISMEKGDEICYYLYDGHGNVRILANAEGRITDRYTYDAYGNLLEKEGDTENEFLYTGEQYNANTGLYYLRARYMNPSTGTFISMDSYQGSIYDPVSLHKYLYANANPVLYTDPSGYSPDNMIALEGNSILTVEQAWNESVLFRVGMQALTQVGALRTVRAISYISATVILSIVVEDAMNHRYYTNAYDIAVEILQYASDNIESICKEAGIVNETIAEQIRTAIYEAKKNGKKGGQRKKGGQGKKDDQDVNNLGEADINDLNKVPNDVIDELGGEDFTQGTKRGSGKSKSDLYWDKDGNIYSVPKKGGPPQWVNYFPRRK